MHDGAGTLSHPDMADPSVLTRIAERLERELGTGLTISPLMLMPDEVRQGLESDDRFVRLIIETGVELNPTLGHDARITWGGIRPMPGARASDNWREHARQDWQRMHLHPSVNDGAAAGIFLQQATEKFLKGSLLDRDWPLQKTHDLETLLEAAGGHDSSRAAFRPLCERVSRDYLAERYLGGRGASPDAQQVRLDAAEAVRLIRTLFLDEHLG